jgi:hypothetical protein
LIENIELAELRSSGTLDGELFSELSSSLFEGNFLKSDLALGDPLIENCIVEGSTSRFYGILDGDARSFKVFSTYCCVSSYLTSSVIPGMYIFYFL